LLSSPLITMLQWFCSHHTLSVTSVLRFSLKEAYSSSLNMGNGKFWTVTLLKLMGRYFSKISLGMGLGKSEASSHRTWLFIGNEKVDIQLTRY